jgi:hypothetical protein
MSIHLLDDLVSTATHQALWQVFQQPRWFFGHQSTEEHAPPFWKMFLDEDLVANQLWSEVKQQCEALAGGELMVLRQYANGHTYGQGGLPHTDDRRPGSFTLLYYPMPQWEKHWDGETIFLDDSGEVARAITPKPNRLVFFDARITHAGRAPSRACPGLRVTVAYKLILKSSFEAQKLPSYELEKWHCEPFDAQAQEASKYRLRQALLERLAKEYLGEVEPAALAQEVANVGALLAQDTSVTAGEIQEIASQRLRSGLAIVEIARYLVLESGAPRNEERVIEALLRYAKITPRQVSRAKLLDEGES